MSKAADQAKEFLACVKKYGWEVSRVQPNLVTITKRIPRCDNDAFVKADMEYYGILDMAPGKGGSIWGTDGGGIGALTAINSGVFTMNKSGIQSRFADALKKLVG